MAGRGRGLVGEGKRATGVRIGSRPLKTRSLITGVIEIVISPTCYLISVFPNSRRPLASFPVLLPAPVSIACCWRTSYTL